MRILIDTNILIPLESPIKMIDKKVTELCKLASQYNIQILIHDANIKDFDRYKNQEKKEILLPKLNRYQKLEDTGEPDSNFLKKINSSYATDRVRSDDKLLYALFKNSINLLITNDNGIHSKAKLLGIEERVYRLEQALSFIEKTFCEKEIIIPNIKDEFVYNISDEEPIFKEIEQEYEDFFSWLNSTVKPGGRKAWIFKDDKSKHIGAICIYKKESDLFDIKGKLLKLCTFRVDENSRGKKLGELLLKTAFKYCVENEFKATYVTLFPEKQSYLINLLEDFGFRFLKEIEKKEHVYIKYFSNENINIKESMITDNLGFHIRYSPYFKNSLNINKFIIPIQPKYHKILFPDNQKEIKLFHENDPYGNAIKKAYICHSKTRTINKGDLVYFYRSHDYKAIVNIGIVEEILITKNSDELAAFVGKRSVYGLSEITGFCKKETLAILFRQIKNFDIFFNRHELYCIGIINTIYSITKIKNEGFKKIFVAIGGKIDDSFFADKTDLCV